jgi:hypothetical protein
MGDSLNQSSSQVKSKNSKTKTGSNYKKILSYALVIIVACILLAEWIVTNHLANNVSESSDVKEVINVVENFGRKLQAVSLQAPYDILEQSMRKNYSEFVSEDLINKWLNDPLNAPGRLTSSPWPDRIEILDVEKISEDEYQVEGDIIEITSVEQESGGIAAKRPITLKVKKINEKWIINDVTMGEYESTSSMIIL